MKPATVITYYTPGQRVLMFVGGLVKLVSLAVMALPLLFLGFIWFVLTCWVLGPVFGFGGPALMTAQARSSRPRAEASTGFAERDDDC